MASPKHKHPFKGTVAQMAEKLGVCRTHLAEILNGTEYASGTLAFAIQDYTRGRIKAKSLIRPKEKATPPKAA